MSEDTRTIIGTGSKISLAMIVILASPAVWMLSLMYEMKADMKGMKNEIEYFHMNCWTVSDMERYRFQSQIANATIGVKLPEVQEILRLRTK